MLPEFHSSVKKEEHVERTKICPVCVLRLRAEIRLGDEKRRAIPPLAEAEGLPSPDQVNERYAISWYNEREIPACFQQKGG